MQTCSSQKGWFLIHKTVSIFFNLLPLSIKLCIRVEALSKCWGDENEATLHTCQLWNQIVSKTRLMIVSIESIKYTKKIQIVFWQKKKKNTNSNLELPLNCTSLNCYQVKSSINDVFIFFSSIICTFQIFEFLVCWYYYLINYFLERSRPTKAQSMGRLRTLKPTRQEGIN